MMMGMMKVWRYPLRPVRVMIKENGTYIEHTLQTADRRIGDIKGTHDRVLSQRSFISHESDEANKS